MRTVEEEKLDLAREIELGRRVTVYSHLENGSPFGLIHIEELIKWAQRIRNV